MNTILNRLQSPTPSFFSKLRNISILIAAIAGTILAAPVALPALVVQIVGYIALAGTVAGAVSQTAVKPE